MAFKYVYDCFGLVTLSDIEAAVRHWDVEEMIDNRDGTIKLKKRSQEDLLYRVAAKVAALEVRVKQLEKKVEFLENEHTVADS